MAEFLGQKKEPEMDPFNQMGKPIPFPVREEAYQLCKEWGLSNARAYECVSGVCTMLERDKPYEAMAHGMKFVDLTGTYRLFAVLLAGAAEYRKKEKAQ
jgi:hypothetical protein